VAGAPVLGTGIALLSLPLGERSLSACYYLGSLLVLGTTAGSGCRRSTPSTAR
jgi:hypothetical protein